MADSENKNPDYLLTLVKKEVLKEGQGRLKIFLGMVAGVGKTYAMLQAAKQKKVQGVDVLVGLVETHGRQDTADLLTGFEILPRRKLEHRGVILEEFDVDAAKARKPKIILVDELAHTNAPNSRHNKRYLDILELLDVGIDVFTTLNVQHIESRVDTVREITNVTVHETVPDSILDRADEVVLIDLPPDELLKRLNEGLVYSKENAELAAKNFFQRGNLTALREMALRVAAERVDRELREYKVLHGIEATWKAGGRLMVGVFASPFSETMIRWTRRVADLLNVTWIGAYVENEKHVSDEEKQLLAKNIALVSHLGGELISTRDNDPVKGLLRIANQNSVTQIMVGKSQRDRLSDFFRGGSVVNRLLKLAGGIDIYVVATDRGRLRRTRKQAPRRQRSPLPFDEMGWVIGGALMTWLIAAVLRPLIGYLAVGIVFLIAVSIAGVFLTRFSVFFLALVFAFLHNYFFIPPLHTFSVSKPEDFMMLVAFFVAAAVIGHLTSRLASKEKILISREERAITLYGVTKEIAAAQSAEAVIKSGVERLREVLSGDIGVFGKSKFDGGPLIPALCNTLRPDEKDLTVASWVLQHGKPAGRFTDTLSAAQGTYLPINGKSGVLGVLGLKLEGASDLDPEQRTLVETFLHQIAAGIERESYHDQLRALLVVEETQKLYKSLLDCVSHELKTPLATIKGSASALLDEKTTQNQSAIRQLSSEILSASGRLQRLVENLLDMTRVESGMLHPKEEIYGIEEVIGTALSRLDSLRGGHTVRVKIRDGTPPIKCDPVLLDQALVNILHNGFIYTPPTSDIEISAWEGENQKVSIEVRDHGLGLPEERPEKVFDKFFRASPQNSGGIGLGLSIARGFIEAQGGELSAANHRDGGAVFTLRLPKGKFA